MSRCANHKWLEIVVFKNVIYSWHFVTPNLQELNLIIPFLMASAGWLALKLSHCLWAHIHFMIIMLMTQFWSTALHFLPIYLFLILLNWFSRIASQSVLANVSIGSISSPSLPLQDFTNYSKLQKSATYGFSEKLTEHSRRFCSTITRVENVPESMRNRHRPSCSTSTSCRLPSSSSTFRNTTSCHIHSHAFNSARAYYLPYE